MTKSIQHIRTIVFATLMLGASSEFCMAQLAANAYVPIEHWTMPYIEHLIRRHVLEDPSPLVRPFTVLALREKLIDADTTAMTSNELDVFHKLRATFPTGKDWVGLSIEADAGVVASTHSRRNSDLRDEGDSYVAPRFGANGVLQGKWSAIVMHPEFDSNLKNDPDYGGVGGELSFFYPEAYIAIRTKYFEVDLGKMRRNWGPVGLPGTVVSDVPYAYDQIYLKAGVERLYGHVMVTQLDDHLQTDGIDVTERFFVAHGYRARPWHFIDIAVWEGMVVADPDRSWEMWFLNPVPSYLQNRDEQNRSNTNVLLGGDGEIRIGNGLRLAGSFALDDLQFVPTPDKNDEPPSFALSAVADWPVGPTTLSLLYTRVSNLTYRTHNLAESFLVDRNLDRGRLGVGLARNFSDYDLTGIKAEFLFPLGFLVTPEVAYLRQGEGDLRLPFPPPEDISDTPTIFAGTVEKTLRLAVQGDLAHPSGIHVTVNAGVHLVSDFEHVPGATDTRFVGTVHVRYRIGNSWALD